MIDYYSLPWLICRHSLSKHSKFEFIAFYCSIKQPHQECGIEDKTPSLIDNINHLVSERPSSRVMRGKVLPTQTLPSMNTRVSTGQAVFNEEAVCFQGVFCLIRGSVNNLISLIHPQCQSLRRPWAMIGVEPCLECLPL